MAELAHLYTSEEAEKYPKNFNALDMLLRELEATNMGTDSIK
jgi:hypothetical protein